MPKKIKYKDWPQEKKDIHRIACNKWIDKNKKKHLAHVKEYGKKYRKKNGDIIRAGNRRLYKKTHPNMIKAGWDIKKPYEREQYIGCIECGTSKRPYYGKGLCNLCYERNRKEYKANWFQEKQKKRVGTKITNK